MTNTKKRRAEMRILGVFADRRKRRRSPSPLGPRGDTYIPSYHRDRSPPYRERRDYHGGGSMSGGGGGGGGYGPATGGGFGGGA